MRLSYIFICFVLGFMVSTANADTYEEGLALFKATEYKKAMKIWQPLAEQGEVAAQVKMGSIFSHGLGVRRNPAEAIRWFKKAAEQGDPEAQYNLGNLYGVSQIGINLDQAESVKWYRKAAEQGYLDAQYSLGAKYFKGEGLPQDYVMGYAWMEVAARQGHHSAPNYRDLIGMILTAEDIEKSKSIADDLLKKFGKDG